MATEFPVRARREDPVGWMTVQRMVEFLRDAFDGFVNDFVRGQATITSGNTAVTVNHGLNRSTYSVGLAPTADPGGRFWISGKTAAQFTINISVAAGIGGAPFDWLAKGD
jgi:hypothetical protein